MALLVLIIPLMALILLAGIGFFIYLKLRRLFLGLGKPNAKDPRLNTVVYRTVIALGTRSRQLNGMAVDLAKTMQMADQEDTVKLGETLLDELTADYLSFKK